MASGLRTADCDCDCGWLTDEWTAEFPWAAHEARKVENSATRRLGSSRIRAPHWHTCTLTGCVPSSECGCETAPIHTQLLGRRFRPQPLPLPMSLPLPQRADCGVDCAHVALKLGRRSVAQFAFRQPFARSPTQPLSREKSENRSAVTVSPMLTARQSGLWMCVNGLQLYRAVSCCSRDAAKCEKWHSISRDTLHLAKNVVLLKLGVFIYSQVKWHR